MDYHTYAKRLTVTEYRDQVAGIARPYRDVSDKAALALALYAERNGVQTRVVAAYSGSRYVYAGSTKIRLADHGDPWSNATLSLDPDTGIDLPAAKTLIDGEINRTNAWSPI